MGNHFKSGLAAIALAVLVGSMCFQAAGKRYGISPLVLRAISTVESGGRVRAIRHNSRRSVDVGHMQINTFWRKYLGRKKWRLVKKNPCYCTMVGAWILKKCIRRYGYTWEAVACYHTGKGVETPGKRAKGIRYIKKVHAVLQELPENKEQ